MKQMITKEFEKKLLAEGFTRQSIWNWKTGRATPSKWSMKVIERILMDNGEKEKTVPDTTG